MKHHESRLQADLGAIRDSVEEVSQAVREGIDEAVRGLLAGDLERMYLVILGDHPINRKTRAIDAACHAFVARHIPAAGHLRFVSSVLRMSIALERIGDYARTICRVGVHLEGPLKDEVSEDIRLLADQSSRMLELATRAFLRGDVDLARDTAKMSRKVDKTHDRVFSHLMVEGETHSLMDVIRLQTVYDKLERVSDQAKNICEEAVFVGTGQTKAPKVYKVLFLDADDSLLAPLAEALARRTFPESGKFASAGLQAADAYSSSLRAVEEQLQLDLEGPKPVTLSPLVESPAEYHVVVALNLPMEALPPMPFHTVLVRWSFDLPDDPAAPKAELVRELNDRIAGLMEILRGSTAS